MGPMRRAAALSAWQACSNGSHASVVIGSSVSAFIAGALGKLAREGILAFHGDRATGFWSYNGGIGYWALPPPPPTNQLFTWAEFAAMNGLDPQQWDLTRP
jgi:hypothetical protein